MRRLLIWFLILFGIDLSVANILVFQSGDTLKFYNGDSLTYQWILKKEERVDGGYYIERAGVAKDNKRFFICEENSFPEKDSIYTRLTVYNANRKKEYTRVKTGKRKISAELTKIYPDKLVICFTDRLNDAPKLEIIKNYKTKQVIDLKQWTSIIDYEFSSNGRYIIFHAIKPYNYRRWDYIYFLDLKTGKTWEYLFPICFSCKRGRIVLKVYDDGRSEAIYKNEHRIFDRDGNLVDIFVKMD
uniref:Dipeptidylpeptidase IV N-terminal domain-containing protein n=1 Tax=candidate division WOR-3 bacterium TaxID=2052148 RepID=A0A7V3RGL4_UNCW3